MVQSQFSLSWDSYKSSICNGFSSLQQNGEFVDMTIAADGHYVKVHQVLVALASPYLKELISSAPCQHPVVFLNNISHRTLSLLLMYIYTGEVMVPSDYLAAFADAAKALHIKGLENLTGYEGMTLKVAENTSQMEERDIHASGIRSMNIPMNEGTNKIDLPAAARKIIVKTDHSSLRASDVHRKQMVPAQEHRYSQEHTSKPEYVEIDVLEDPQNNNSDDNFNADDSFAKQVAKAEPDLSDTPPSNLQFTVSIRGSLQIILNRYVYNLHSSKQAGGVRRWRCTDYRNHKCMAFVVTKGNVVLSRANLHNHSFHDKKILSKIEKKCVYSALDEVCGYKEKAAKLMENDSSMEQDDFPMLEDFSSGMTEITDKTTEFMKGKIN